MIDAVEKYSILFGEDDDKADSEIDFFYEKLAEISPRLKDILITEFKPYFEARLGEKLSDEQVVKLISIYPLLLNRILCRK